MADTERLLGRYEYQRELGRGAEGRVLQVLDHAAGGALRALKCVGSAHEQRVRWEFSLLSQLAHPNLARVHELVRIDATGPHHELPAGALALVSELAVGLPADELARQHAADKATLLRLCWLVLDRVARALSVLHAHGFVHADVKPQNIIVREDLSDAKLIDLGLARQPGVVREVSGTLGYIAPELWRAELSPAADLFALGVSAAGLLAPTRRREDASLSAQALTAALRAAQRPQELPSWVPAPLGDLLGSLRAAAPSDRPASARDVLGRVEALGSLSGQKALAAGAAIAQERSAAERAAALSCLPLVGQAAPLARLTQVLQASGVSCVVGPSGSGRSRLVREAVGLVQSKRAADGGDVPTYRVEEQLPAQLPAHACVLHLRDAEAIELQDALALLRSAEVAGHFCHVVLERSTELAAAPVTIRVEPLTDPELERLLAAALPGLAVKATLLREAQAVSGGLAGRLCRVACAVLAAGDELSRAGQLRAHALEAGAERALELPAAVQPLAHALAVCGGSLPQELAQAYLVEPEALAVQARTLVALGACSFGARSELTLRPDLVRALWSRLEPRRRTELGRRFSQARLATRARAFVACAAEDRQLASALFLEALGACMRRGEPEAALALASDARALLGPLAGNALDLAQAEALRAMGQYARALQLLAADEGAEVDVARAELLRLTGRAAQAQELAERALRTPGQREPVRLAATVILARLAFDAGALEQAEALALPAVTQNLDGPSELRAREVLALCQLRAGQLQGARATLEQALARARTLAERAAEARLLALLGTLCRAEGDLHQAGLELARAFELAQAAGEYHAAASFLVNVGTSHLDSGQLGPALLACREGARRLARLGRERDLGRVLYNLALAGQLTGDYDAALAALAQAQRCARASDDLAALAFSQVLAAEIHAERGERAQALASLHALPEPACLPELERGVACARAAAVAAELAETELAERHVACADACAEPQAAECELAHCALARLRGEPRAAFEAAERALAAARQRGEFGVQLTALLASAHAAEAVNDAPMARQRFAELRSLLDAAALTLAPAERARLRQVKSYRAALAALPGSVGPQANDERWRKLAALTKRFTAEQRSSRIHEIVLDAALDLSGAERGYVLWNDADGVPRVRAGRGLDREAVRTDAVSRSIVQRVMASGQPLSTVDAAQDVRLTDAVSVHALHLRSVLAVPIVAHAEVCGALYLDDRLRPFAFGEAEIALLSDLADLAAIALESAERLRRERRASRRLQIARARLARQLQAQSVELDSLKRQGAMPTAHPGIVAHSAAMQHVLELATRVGASDVPVLLRGESGSGKELVARVIHEHSPRQARPLVSENCGAIPETLLESALFGHVRGAFTGADKRRLGLFEVADGGTLFLDEIGEMSAAMQARLLRVLQNGEIRPVGAERSSSVDVRIIAATHRDLEAMVAQGLFREDLYYRLAVVPVLVPPLRERVEDIAPLVQHFIDKHAPGRKLRVERRALDALCAQSWPGNVRQLENEVRRALVLAGEVIREEHWSFGAPREGHAQLAELDLRGQVDELERRLIRRALDNAKGNQTRAAELLGLSRFGLQKMQKRLAGAR